MFTSRQKSIRVNTFPSHTIRLAYHLCKKWKLRRTKQTLSIFRKPYIYSKRKIEYLRYLNRIQYWIDNGLQLGNNVTIMPSVYIDGEYGYLIKIGDNCSISHNVRINAHDATPFKFINEHTILGKTTIHNNVYIGENVTILSGCTIGPNVIIASGSVINKDIPPDSCVAGVPARRYQSFENYLERHKAQISKDNVVGFGELNGPHHHQVRRKVIEMISRDGLAYVHGYTENEFVINGKDFK